ncbi:MAG TPA: TonB-dependent receptor, partial [Vicinamibacterales bacterium]|nr:TonB-dependent receptor [Vicinamibacterales bacterium]
MTVKALRNTVLIALMLWVCAPGAALAQSAIAGIVKDTSGAVLPGVNVEAASPALIEGTRSVVTDAFGQYKIVDLRPGVYTVTFSLQGFSTVRREGIELSTNFTAPVNADLQVGALQETVTVSGSSPMVDVQQAVTQQVLPQALLDAVPTGGRNIQSVGAVLVGVTQSAPDVGGAAGMQQNYLAAHGTDPRDVTIMVDGIRLNGIEGDGAIQQYFNEGMFSEMSYQTGGMAADTAGGGVRLNMIPKDGGNTFRGDVFFSATGHSLQADAFPADVAALGLKSGNYMSAMHDINISAGGPLIASKLWFFGSFRHWGVDQSVAQSFAGLPNAPELTSFTPDLSNPVIDTNTIKSFMGRVTYQASPKHKFSYYLDRIIKFRGNEQNSPTGTSPVVWAADTFSTREPKIYYMTEAKYTGTWSSKLLFEAGLGINNESYTTGELQPSLEQCLGGGTCAPAPRVDLGTNQFWGGPAGPYYFRSPIRDTLTSSLSYITGSHAFKLGMELSHGLNNIQQAYQNSNINFVQRYQNGVPNSVSIVNTPIDEHDRSNELGVYAQDTWTFKRMTITPGLRWEYFSAKYL